MYDMDECSDDESWKQTLSGVNLDFIKEKYSYLHATGRVVMDNAESYSIPGFKNHDHSNENESSVFHPQKTEQFENLHSDKNGCSALLKNNAVNRDYNYGNGLREHREANAYLKNFEEGAFSYKTVAGHTSMESTISNYQNQINSTIPQHFESMQFSQMLEELEQIDNRTFHPDSNVNKLNDFEIKRPMEETYSLGQWHF